MKGVNVSLSGLHARVTTYLHRLLYLAGRLFDVNFAIPFLACNAIGIMMTDSCGCWALQQMKVDWPVWCARDSSLKPRSLHVDKYPSWLPVSTRLLSNRTKEDRVAVYCLNLRDLVNSIDYDDVIDTFDECKARIKTTNMECTLSLSLVWADADKSLIIAVSL
jgi:hypothetical protein